MRALPSLNDWVTGDEVAHCWLDLPAGGEYWTGGTNIESARFDVYRVPLQRVALPLHLAFKLALATFILWP